MSEWTEDTIRAAASWQAFKAGKSHFESGIVEGLKKLPDGVRGKLKSGKRPISVMVKIISAVEIEARCSCPQNQSTGEFCEHAVAVCLAALAGDRAADTASPSKLKPASEVAAPLSHEVVLMGEWMENLKRGRLVVQVRPNGGLEMTAEQRELHQWLLSQSVASGTQVLNLSSHKALELIERLAGIESVRDQDGRTLDIQQGAMLSVLDTELPGERLQLKAMIGDSFCCELGKQHWLLNCGSMTGLGSGEVPKEIGQKFRELCYVGSVELSRQELLGELDRWQELASFSEEGWLQSLRFVSSQPQFHLQLDGGEAQLKAELLVKYLDGPWVAVGGSHVPSLPRLDGKVCQMRHEVAEREAMRELSSHGFVLLDEGRWKLDDRESLVQFLAVGLKELEKKWVVDSSPRLSQWLQQLEVVHPTIEMMDEVDGRTRFNLRFSRTDGVDVDLVDVQSMLRSGGRRKVGGKQVVLASAEAEMVTSLMAELELEQRDGSYLASPVVGEVMRELQAKLSGARGRELDNAELPISVQADLRPYQQAGYEWMVDRMERFGGALLADDMGLGKTVQTIALVEHWLSPEKQVKGVVLIVVTTSLLGNWKSEFEKFASARRVHVMHGTDRDSLRDQIADGDVVLTSYGTLARDLAWHLKQDYLGVIVDEASVMRNPNTDHAKALFKLKSRCRLALTGTPIENGVRDLWSIFRFIQPGWLGQKSEFLERYAVQTGEAPDPHAMERLRMKMSPFVLRRAKEEVAPELPAKWVIDEYCEMSRDQEVVYQKLREEGLKQIESAGGSNAGRMQVLTALLRLRQTCCDLALLGSPELSKLSLDQRSAKLARLMELLEQAVSGGHRVLVFSQFQKQLLEIEKAVSNSGWGSLRLDGQTRDRQKMVDEFQSAEGPPIFLISLKAGGYGLNLTAADIVVHFDPWWNPAAEAQATDRAHRIGQTRPVTVYRLLTRNTVEDKVVRMQRQKRDLARMVDETGQADAPGWSEQELKSLLAP